MRKVLLITAIIAALTIGLFALTGCENKDVENVVNELSQTQLVGGWETKLTNEQVNLNEEALKIFTEARNKYTALELDPVALIAQQVVAGTNRMYLAKGYQKGEPANALYEMVKVYTDLANNSSITEVCEFDYSEYTNVNVEGNEDILAGGWTVSVPTKGAKLEEKVQAIFDKATSTITGVTYYPIALVGKQLVAGTNYAILCYATPSTGEEVRGTINLVTIYEDLTGTATVTSQAYVNLANFNK